MLTWSHLISFPMTAVCFPSKQPKLYFKYGRLNNKYFTCGSFAVFCLQVFFFFFLFFFSSVVILQQNRCLPAEEKKSVNRNVFQFTVKIYLCFSNMGSMPRGKMLPFHSINGNEVGNRTWQQDLWLSVVPWGQLSPAPLLATRWAWPCSLLPWPSPPQNPRPCFLGVTGVVVWASSRLEGWFCSSAGVGFTGSLAQQ